MEITCCSAACNALPMKIIRYNDEAEFSEVQYIFSQMILIMHILCSLYFGLLKIRVFSKMKHFSCVIHLYLFNKLGRSFYELLFVYNTIFNSQNAYFVFFIDTCCNINLLHCIK